MSTPNGIGNPVDGEIDINNPDLSRNLPTVPYSMYKPADKHLVKQGVAAIGGLLALSLATPIGVLAYNSYAEGAGQKAKIENISTTVKSDVEETLGSEKIFGVPGDDMSIPE